MWSWGCGVAGAVRSAWGKPYPAISQLWRNAWEQFVPFLDCDAEIRAVLCSTNAIESLNARFRRPMGLWDDARRTCTFARPRPDTRLRRASCATICLMSSLTIRTDPEVERALEALTREGLSRSEAARTAILEAERAHRRARLRAEAESLRNDPEDVAASRELTAEMDAIRAW